MLFNSFTFIFLYLPAVWLGFRLLGARDPASQRLWLVLASLVFYGYWDARFLGLLLGSIGFNYAAGSLLLTKRPALGAALRKATLAVAVVANLALLGYFKYSNFFLDNADRVLGAAWRIPDLILPLGISFFTFTQITYLVDAHRGLTADRDLVSYALFVTFFPHLIAGPILHHKEMLPQFKNLAATRGDSQYVALGLFFFAVGLFKKVIVADTLATLSSPVFAGAERTPVGFLDAWTGTLAYTLQLYYDFSGYSDMAVGLGLLFGIRLPFNFDSPYKAGSIIEFWRRWHISLSGFLRDYVYVPLGGNRRGEARRYVNIMLTMLIGGLWHGAGWTFVAWGGAHGALLLVNHGYRALRGSGRAAAAVWSRPLTLLCVALAWVLFRSKDLATAGRMFRGLVGLTGVTAASHVGGAAGHVLLYELLTDLWTRVEPGILVAAALLAAYLATGWLRNTQEMALGSAYGRMVWTSRSADPSPLVATGLTTGHVVLAVAALCLSVIGLVSSPPSEFLYFQF
jgi:alginate O-acetyltransferase complex protein AlgI